MPQIKHVKYRNKTLTLSDLNEPFFGNKNGSLTGMSAFMSELNVDLLIYFSYMLQTHRLFAS